MPTLTKAQQRTQAAQDAAGAIRTAAQLVEALWAEQEDLRVALEEHFSTTARYEAAEERAEALEAIVDELEGQAQACEKVEF